MIAALIRLDLALLRRSKAFWLLIALLSAAAALALVSGLDWRARYLGAADAAREQVAADRKVLIEVYDGLAAGTGQPTNVDTYDGKTPFVPDPRDPYVEGFYHTRLAELPAGPLLGLATGSSELRATHHVIKTVPIVALMRIGEPAERVNPGALAAGRFDLLAFIMFLCPLALVALLFDACAREREAGLAPLLAGLGAGRRELLLARGITRGGAVLAVAMIASVAGIALVGALGSAAALWWLAGVAAYLAMWTALLLLVASSGLSVIGSAAITVSLWVALLLLSPGMVERTLRPSGLIEPRALAEAEVRTVIREATASDAARAAAKQRVAEQYWAIDFATAPACADREGVLSEYVERRLSDESYKAAMLNGAAREALYDARLDQWSWLSPALAFRRAMETVAGTDPARQRAFEAQVFGYHAAVRGRVTDAIFACRSFDRAAFEAAPGFTYSEPDRGVAGWSGIVLAGGLALLLAALALRRRPLFA